VAAASDTGEVLARRGRCAGLDSDDSSWTNPIVRHAPSGAIPWLPKRSPAVRRPRGESDRGARETGPPDGASDRTDYYGHGALEAAESDSDVHEPIVLVAGCSRINGGKGDGLRPPRRVLAMTEERIDHGVIELPRCDQLSA
jgi:hypothetical protein